MLLNRYPVSMKYVKRFLRGRFYALFPEPSPSGRALNHVKLQKRCVGLTRREKDFVQAQVSLATNPMLKELFLCNARGSIFSRPGSITYAVYH